MSGWEQRHVAARPADGAAEGGGPAVARRQRGCQGASGPGLPAAARWRVIGRPRQGSLGTEQQDSGGATPEASGFCTRPTGRWPPGPGRRHAAGPGLKARQRCSGEATAGRPQRQCRGPPDGERAWWRTAGRRGAAAGGGRRRGAAQQPNSGPAGNSGGEAPGSDRRRTAAGLRPRRWFGTRSRRRHQDEHGGKPPGGRTAAHTTAGWRRHRTHAAPTENGRAAGGRATACPEGDQAADPLGPQPCNGTGTERRRKPATARRGSRDSGGGTAGPWSGGSAAAGACEPGLATPRRSPVGRSRIRMPRETGRRDSDQRAVGERRPPDGARRPGGGAVRRRTGRCRQTSGQHGPATAGPATGLGRDGRRTAA